MKNDIMLISSGYDQQIKFWSDFNNNKCKHIYEIHKNDGPVNSLEMLPNNIELAFAVNNNIKFLDLETISQSQSTTISSHSGIVNNILFYKDNSQVFFSGGEDAKIKLNDRRIGKCVKELKHTSYITSLQLGLNNNELIASDESGYVKVWDINIDKPRTEYKFNSKAEGNSVRSISVSEYDNFIVAGLSNGTCNILEYSDNKQLKLINSFNAHSSYITKLLLNPEKNILATCSADNEVKVWSRTNNNSNNFFSLDAKLIGHRKWVWDCCFSIDSAYLVTCSTDKSIRLWSLEEYKQVSNLICTKGVTKIVICDEDSE